jgi:hypothetical protein
MSSIADRYNTPLHIDNIGRLTPEEFRASPVATQRYWTEAAQRLIVRHLGSTVGREDSARHDLVDACRVYRWVYDRGLVEHECDQIRELARLRETDPAVEALCVALGLPWPIYPDDGDNRVSFVWTGKTACPPVVETGFSLSDLNEHGATDFHDHIPHVIANGGEATLPDGRLVRIEKNERYGGYSSQPRQGWEIRLVPAA